EHFAGLGVNHRHAVARPGAAAEIAPVLAHGAAVRAGELLGREARDDLAGLRIDLGYPPVARAPEKAVGIERDVAHRRRILRFSHPPLHALEIAGVRIESVDRVRPVLRAPHVAFRINLDPVRAGEYLRALARNPEFLHHAGFSVEPANEGRAVRAVPDVAL